MTEEAIERIANLFLNDIEKLTYTVNDSPKEKKIFKSYVKNGNVEILFKIDSSEIGTFDNFKLIGKNKTVYATKILNFQKTNDEIIIEFPFLFMKEGEK
ncbi:hypothetical protein [Clostridium haemolyticum]|uniref:Uncharacterized protein n=1 Tax=Clostridium haemolyticum NCTC 9693 TaxID=1443114 RepID=A0ABR4TGW4_CLOHA|nr:hypothetical protein [Clostridium haemolyticum]KEI18242.1 hypothetical protein Z960_03725 [Clostridium haemolyticum NCTC 9693]KGN04164.1 hypothetical protein Z961_04220 [Clostridium haemolyticum NCTC 8350]